MNHSFVTPSWVRNTTIYEVNLRQYTAGGSFSEFAGELERLRDMGVETLWFMPLTPISMKNRKGSLGSYYACSDYVSINPEFGTEDEFVQLVENAHALGMRVVIDWVANHTGWDHHWTESHRDFYKIDPLTGDFRSPDGMSDIIELDHSNPALTVAMIAAMQTWITRFSIDGFRCDLASWVRLPFWRQARLDLDAAGPLFWLGEFDELENPEYGEVFDASYSWRWMHATQDFYGGGKPLSDLVTILKQYDDLGDQTMRTWFTSNHDENSWNGTEYEKYVQMAQALAVFSATWNGIPLVYSGQELPNTKRLKFFDKDYIDWTGTCELELFYRDLLELHRSHPAMAAGDPRVRTFLCTTNAPDQVLAFIREAGDQRVYVLINFSDRPCGVRIHDHLGGLLRNIFTGETARYENGAEFLLGSWQWLVFNSVA